MEAIQVHMLGEFTIRYGENVISDTETRSRKVWNLLAYLIYNHDRIISQQKLIDLLWGEDSSSADPKNVMRITLHRARTMLDQLYEGAGKELIVYKNGGYAWNSEIATEIDCIRFLQLVQAEAADDEARLCNLTEALHLYQGAFLPRQSSEMWAIPTSTHFQTRFLNITMEAADMLAECGRYKEAVIICRKAAETEPYHEPLYQRLIQCLAASGDLKGATKVFDKLSKRLSDDFGIQPSEETRSAYRGATMSPKERQLPVEEILDDLQEPEALAGAMQCDYDYFKVLCFAESRAMERNQNETHVALISVANSEANGRKKGDTDKIMDKLGEKLRQNLRRGDVISRCSATQYIVMLLNANYENSCMVCRRLIASFKQSEPAAAENLNFIVQPLTSGMRVP